MTQLLGIGLAQEDFLEEAALRSLEKTEQDTAGPKRVKASNAEHLELMTTLKMIKNKDLDDPSLNIAPIPGPGIWNCPILRKHNPGLGI